jgi:hypothetical protein
MTMTMTKATGIRSEPALIHFSGRRMKREHFVKVAAEVFDSLPQKFRSRIRGGLTL